MKTSFDFSGQDVEVTTSEHERWTNAILKALYELRSASVTGLDKHFGETDEDLSRRGFVSPLAGTIPPPPRTTH